MYVVGNRHLCSLSQIFLDNVSEDAVKAIYFTWILPENPCPLRIDKACGW